MKRKNKFLYSSSIKLGPALGDWTQLSSDDLDDEYFDVTSISSTNFDKLSRKELKRSHLIHHKLANLIAKHLSKDMNIKIELHTIMVTQILYSDFINSINDNIFQADLNIGEQGSINLIFGSNLASMMIDRLTGGSGENTEKSSFNELEMTLLNEQLQEIIPFFSSSWKESLDMSNAKLSLYSGQYKVDNKISYRETYIVFTIYLYFGDGELMRLMVAYPNEVIRNLLKDEQKAKQVISPEIKLQQDTLDKVSYNVKAELGSIELPMQSLSEISEGDVIPLNQTINTLIKLDIGNKIKLYAQPCIYKNKVGCQVIVTDDYKSNIILSKKPQVKDEAAKKLRLPISEIIDQGKHDKQPILKLESEAIDEEDQDHTMTNKDFDDTTNDIFDTEQLNSQDAEPEVLDNEINLDNSHEDSDNQIASEEVQSENQQSLGEDLSLDSNETENQQDPSDLKEESHEEDAVSEQEFDSDSESTAEESGLEDGPESAMNNADESESLSDLDDFDLNEDELLSDTSGTDAVDEQDDNTEVAPQENNSSADDIFDEEMDFGDIEASLEDDELDWDESEPTESK